MDVSFAVDVSNNQASHQDWRSFGVHMGIAKASEGERSRDPWFVRHISDIKAAGLIPGAYHFAWPNQDVGVEAANYIAAVRPHAAGCAFVHALDLEPYPNGALNYAGVTNTQIKAYATAWVGAVKRAFPGQEVLCYTPRDTASLQYPTNASGYWYPAYPVQGRSFSAAAKLTRPTVGGRPVWGWQFTSVPRDQTVIYMNPKALAAWAAGATPTVQEDDMPLTKADIELLLDTEMDDPTSTDDKKKVTIRGALWAGYGQAAAANAAAQHSAAQVGALQGVVAQLLAMVQKGGGLTAQQAAAAAEAGAKAALSELGDALQG